MTPSFRVALLAALSVMTLGACSSPSSPGERALVGGVIGAGLGAGAASLTGGKAGTGAGIGAATGMLAGIIFE